MKNIFAIAAFGSVFAVSAVQAAGNGTINFTGAVNNQTCNAAINGAGGENAASVSLPTVQADTLASEGKTAGQTAFKMDITDCAANQDGANTVKAYFEQGPNVDTNGRLINTATANRASNVVLELVDDTAKTPIKVGDISQNSGSFVAITDGNATLPYSVRYYATDAATAGSVTSSVTYSLVYN